jgi:hypothetical protein
MILRSHQRTKDPEIKKYWTAQQLQHQTAMVQVILYIYSIIQDPTEWARLSFQSSELAPPASSTRK